MLCIIFCMLERIDANPACRNRYGLGLLRLHRLRSETSHDACAIASVAMGVPMELGVADPVPPLDAPTLSHQLQQSFWACAEAGRDLGDRPIMDSRAERRDIHLLEEGAEG